MHRFLNVPLDFFTRIRIVGQVFIYSSAVVLSQKVERFFGPTLDTIRATLEYQGELFISLGDIEGAKKNHRYLQILCGPEKWPELRQLGQALADAGHPVE